ncbi:MAG: hypothetical protein LBU96_12970 [Yokenella regensburgei]|jgi:hypothetical protein|nr:hypothetical protein [Yokenella regensburgei]MDQ4429490.1 hypothetical protein [Yokenella regensburgei]MDR2217156.1 hypothetical protein [Yokenella regensburgei]MDR3105348.1 hypothetical protein [Yokenella regensburgei]
MAFALRCLLGTLLLMLISIPVVSDCVAIAIESRFHYLMLMM